MANGMSDRVAGLMFQYIALMRQQTEGTPEEAGAMEDCRLLMDRLKGTFGHVEHEIIGDEIEAAIKEATQ